MGHERPSGLPPSHLAPRPPLRVLRRSEVLQQSVAEGHLRPMHSVRVPINVRCYSNSAIIIRRSAVTLRANRVTSHRGNFPAIGPREVGRRPAYRGVLSFAMILCT